MKSPESFHSQLPDFVAAHDGTQAEVSERERAIVAQKFSSLADDILLNFADKVNHYSGGIPKDSLLLRRPIDESSRWSIGVEAKTQPHQEEAITLPAERTVKSISLQYVANGYGRDSIDYRLGADGVVRRWDGGDAYAKRIKERELDIEQPFLHEGASDEEAMLFAARSLEKLINVDIPNARLEREMGYQLQPIGLEEMDGLYDFIAQPGLEPTR